MCILFAKKTKKKKFTHPANPTGDEIRELLEREETDRIACDWIAHMLAFTSFSGV
jgi:hypothetical protein